MSRVYIICVLTKHCLYCVNTMNIRRAIGTLFEYKVICLYSMHIVGLVGKDPCQWKRISCKQTTRWQYLSRLKPSAFLSLLNNLVVKKCNNLYL